jgi:hypothetical protein
MVGEIVMLPLRVTVRAASLAVRGAEEMATLAFRAIGVVSRHDHSPAPPPQPPAKTTPAKPPRTAGPGPARAAQSRPARPAHPRPSRRSTERRVTEREPEPASPSTPAPPPSPEAEPGHVSEEPTLVEEFAEAGAEEGAGAQVTVDEPWDGYGHMTAQDVLDLIERASKAELAAITLYETANRHRQAILAAVERQRALGGRGESRN